MLSITISITFQGAFGPRGYKLGRLAAALFRLPDGADEEHIGGIPTPCGYAPYESQAPNTPDSMGRILIHHDPRAKVFVGQ